MFYNDASQFDIKTVLLLITKTMLQNCVFNVFLKIGQDGTN